MLSQGFRKTLQQWAQESMMNCFWARQRNPQIQYTFSSFTVWVHSTFFFLLYVVQAKKKRKNGYFIYSHFVVNLWLFLFYQVLYSVIHLFLIPAVGNENLQFDLASAFVYSCVTEVLLWTWIVYTYKTVGIQILWVMLPNNTGDGHCSTTVVFRVCLINITDPRKRSWLHVCNIVP